MNKGEGAWPGRSGLKQIYQQVSFLYVNQNFNKLPYNPHASFIILIDNYIFKRFIKRIWS